jgi:hypothetical protein
MLKCGRVIFEQVLNFPVLLKLSLNEKNLKERPYFPELKKEFLVPIINLNARLAVRYKIQANV